MDNLQRFRCITETPLNLGGFDPPESISPQEIILWNGAAVLKREDGTTLVLKNPGGFKALVNAGWMVPESSTQQVARPRPAGIQMHEAAPRGMTRARVDVSMVDDEERDVGGINAVRRNANTGAVPPSRQASNVAAQSASRSGTVPGKRRIVMDEGQEGVVVGRLKNPPEAAPVEVGRHDRQIVDRLSRVEGQERVAIEKFGSAARRPAPAPEYADEGVTVSSGGGSGIGGEEDGRVVGRVGAPRPQAAAQAAVASSQAARAGANPPGMPIARELPADPVEAMHIWVEYGTTPDGEAAYSEPQLQRLVKALLNKLAAAQAEITELQTLVAAMPEAPEGGEIEIAEASAEEAPAEADYVLDWDLESHWKTRHTKVVTEFKDNVRALRKIAEVDNSVAVKKAAQQRLTELGAA